MAKILYLPIHNPSHHAASVANVRGLYDALVRAGHEVKEVDYCAMPEKYHTIAHDLIEVQPELFLTQFQGTNYVNETIAAAFRRDNPNMIWVNFNQDYWPEHLTSPDMLAMLRHVDLQLVANAAVLPTYAAEGVNAAFWPAAYETANRPLPDVPHHDIVFLGNNYSAKRQQLYEVLRSLPYNVGIYGTGWAQAEGDCNYDFTYAEALYKNAKIAISDNQFPEAVASVSNRLVQILAAGGAVMLQQKVKSLSSMTGITDTVHYFSWEDFDQLVKRMDEIMSIGQYQFMQKYELIQIAKHGQQFVREHHSYDVRVRELMAMVEGLKV